MGGKQNAKNWWDQGKAFPSIFIFSPLFPFNQITERKLLRSHPGVKQCFHTRDVAANNWATAASSAAGPIGAKSAILMKNALIFVAKHTKNLAKNGAWQST